METAIVLCNSLCTSHLLGYADCDPDDPPLPWPYPQLLILYPLTHQPLPHPQLLACTPTPPNHSIARASPPRCTHSTPILDSTPKAPTPNCPQPPTPLTPYPQLLLNFPLTHPYPQPPTLKSHCTPTHIPPCSPPGCAHFPRHFRFNSKPCISYPCPCPYPYPTVYCSMTLIQPLTPTPIVYPSRPPLISYSLNPSPNLPNPFNRLCTTLISRKRFHAAKIFLRKECVY